MDDKDNDALRTGLMVGGGLLLVGGFSWLRWLTTEVRDLRYFQRRTEPILDLAFLKIGQLESGHLLPKEEYPDTDRGM